jgi:uncharacterized protein (TIGR02231 family)
MKNILLIFCFLLIFIASKAQNLETNVESSPNEVTVFLSGAELKHQTELKLVAGQNTFRFLGLPASINPSSISFNLEEDVKIISISGEINYQGRLKPNKMRITLEDSADYFEQEVQKINNEIEALQSEKILLNENMKRIGSNNGVSVLELQNFATHYRNRIREVNDKLLEQNKKISQQKQKAEKIGKILEKIKAKDATPAFELSLIVLAKEAKTTQAKWSYVIQDAGWSTAYDMRAKGIDKPIQFTYKGNVYNNSGIDWNKIKLKLSTADVMQNATPPYITSWKLDFESNGYNQNMLYQQQSNMTMNNIGGDFADNESQTISRSATIPLADVAVSELSTEFEIKELYNIPSDNRAYAVEINAYELQANYSYVSTPKLDKDAFLLAKILGWESLNLIEGEANVYYKDSYVGKTYINLRQATDTLEISLGRDKKVIVNRIKKQEFSSKKFLSSTVTENFTYELTVRNSNAMPIQLDLKDQVPVSGNSEIEVEVLEISGANWDKESGLLTWKVNLAAGEAKNYKLSYAIKSPKNKKVNLQRLKMQRQYKK